MTENKGGTSKPTPEERDREPAVKTGNAAEKGENPSPADDCAAIDLDTVHDRAS